MLYCPFCPLNVSYDVRFPDPCAPLSVLLSIPMNVPCAAFIHLSTRLLFPDYPHVLGYYMSQCRLPCPPSPSPRVGPAHDSVVALTYIPPIYPLRVRRRRALRRGAGPGVPSTPPSSPPMSHTRR